MDTAAALECRCAGATLVFGYASYSSYKLYSKIVSGRIYKRIGRHHEDLDHHSDRIEL